MKPEDELTEWAYGCCGGVGRIRCIECMCTQRWTADDDLDVVVE